jgi:hypothetical protein
MSVFYKKIIILAIIGLFFFAIKSQAVDNKNSFPRLANYFLHWELSDEEAILLARWDLLILDMEVQENSPEQIKKIRQINPDIIILAYITSQEIMSDFIYDDLANLRPEFKKGIIENWYVKDDKGNKISNWPGTYLLNISDTALKNSSGERFNDYLPKFVTNKINASGFWDGIFYDNAWGDIAWVNGGNIDLNNDGKRDDAAYMNRLWEEGFQKIIDSTEKLNGREFIIVGNGRVHFPYQSKINGMMLEGFPSSWENDGTWPGSMQTYFKLSQNNKKPFLGIINVYNGQENNYSLMRYGLASALLGDGYFSYDSSVNDHGQTWWYDEYDFNLGTAKLPAYNTLDGSKTITTGLWRRDFSEGSVLVNSTNKTQTYIFSKETIAKFKGFKDSSFNNGERLNLIKLAPSSGVLLKRIDKVITASSFTNGYFYRYFNNKGQQIQEASFSFSAAYPGDAELFISNKDGGLKTVYTNKGSLVFEGIKGDKNLKPFGNFQGRIGLAAQENNAGIEKLVISAGVGGGPQVLIYDASGNLKGNFFAYNKSLRSGTNIALADVDNDGQEEIITAPGKGGSEIKIFSLSGKLKTKFFAYGNNFKGGVSVAAGDISGDNIAEIVTVPASGGASQVKVFNSDGKLLGTFFGFDKNKNGEFKISLSDIDKNGIKEIIIGQKSPY